MTISKIFDISGKVAAVTGGANGIGLAYAEALAENGAKVALMDIDAETLEKEVKRLTQLGFDVSGELIDVTNREMVKTAFENTVKKYGRLDIAFANAGIACGAAFLNEDGKRNPIGEIDDLDDDMWDRSIAIMLTGVFNTVKTAAKHMKVNNSGSIIVTTSIAAHIVGGQVGTPYMPAKAGAAHFVRQAAIDLAHYNIRVNAIAPGPFVTNIDNGKSKDPSLQEAVAKIIPLGRIAHTDEIKGIALYFASDASSFVTGAELVIDGGTRLGPAG